MRKLRKIVLVCLVFVSSLLAGNRGLAQCDATLWSHVYNSYRLFTHDSCMRVSGTIWSLLYEADGDIHIRLTVDSPFTYLLNATNISQQYGRLVCEPVCATTVTQADAVASCTGFTNTVFIPAVGEHVIVTGPYVTDNDHGWNELHPVSSIVIGSLAVAPVGGGTVTPDVTVYPNPAKAFINFRLSERPSTPVYITIADGIGRLAGQYQMLDMLNLQINTQYLPGGKYYYHIAQDGKMIKGGSFLLEK